MGTSRHEFGRASAWSKARAWGPQSQTDSFRTMIANTDKLWLSPNTLDQPRRDGATGSAFNSL